MNEQVRQFLTSRGYRRTAKRMKKTSDEEEGLFEKFKIYKRSRSASRKAPVNSKLSFEVCCLDKNSN